MPFLNVWIDDSNHKLKLNPYRKPTNTVRYINWQSFVSPHHKLNLIKSLLYRAYSICNSYNVIHKHFQKIVSVLKSNGYRLWYVNTS